MTLAIVSTYTPEEYLEREEKAEIRSEFIDGTIIEMAEATALAPKQVIAIQNSLESSVPPAKTDRSHSSYPDR